MLDGFLFAMGGWEGHSRLDSMECYNPHNNTWQFMQSVKLAVTSPAVVALDGFLYVTGRTGLLHTIVAICWFVCNGSGHVLGDRRRTSNDSLHNWLLAVASLSSLC